MACKKAVGKVINVQGWLKFLYALFLTMDDIWFGKCEGTWCTSNHTAWSTCVDLETEKSARSFVDRLWEAMCLSLIRCKGIPVAVRVVGLQEDEHIQVSSSGFKAGTDSWYYGCFRCVQRWMKRQKYKNQYTGDKKLTETTLQNNFTINNKTR